MENMNNTGTAQKPIRSGFSETSTTADVIRGIDLSGKVAIVTGGYAALACVEACRGSESSDGVFLRAPDRAFQFRGPEL